MKKIICFLLILITPICSFANRWERPAEKTSFTYTGVGVAGFCLIPMGVDLSIGGRTIYNGHHAFDRQIGIGFGLYGQMIYVQGSYLHYFDHNCGSYFGVGLTGGIINWTENRYWFDTGLQRYVNIPVTIGYQYKDGDFFQVQVTPLGAMTATYGIAF